MKLIVPDIGDFDSVEIIEVLVNVGDKVSKEQSLITVESDKASMEIPASDDGVVTKLLVKVGDKVLFGKYAGQAVKVDGDEVMGNRYHQFCCWNIGSLSTKSVHSFLN